MKPWLSHGFSQLTAAGAHELVQLGRCSLRWSHLLVNDQKSRIGGINRDVSTPTLPYSWGDGHQFATYVGVRVARYLLLAK